jgi:hypothetical protein
MDRRTVLTKTAKGLMEVTGKTSLLPRDLRNVLSQVDGKATVGDLHQKLDKYTETKLLDTLGKLSKDWFVREFVSAPASISPPSQVPIVQEDMDLDFTALMSKPPIGRGRAQTRPSSDVAARSRARAAGGRCEGPGRPSAVKAEAASARDQVRAKPRPRTGEAEVAERAADAAEQARRRPTRRQARS